MKPQEIKVIKQKDIESRTAARAATAAAAVDSKAEVRKSRRTGNPVISSWIAERRETIRRSRKVLLKKLAANLLAEVA